MLRDSTPLRKTQNNLVRAFGARVVCVYDSYVSFICIKRLKVLLENFEPFVQSVRVVF